MRHHDATRVQRGFGAREFPRDELIAEPVEAVTAQPLFIIAARQGESVGHERMPMMERGVEARDVRHPREGIDGGAHTGEVVRLVQGRESRKPSEVLHDFFGQAHRRAVALAAMHDPVTDGDHL